MSFFDDASLVMIPSGYKTSKVYSVKPTDGTGDLAFTRSNDTATRVGSDGLIEKVRTNLILQSETFNNASWTKDSATITANTTTAPDGTTTADTLTISDSQYIYQSITLTAGVSYTISLYVRVSSGTNQFKFNTFGSSNTFISSTQTATTSWQRFSFTFTAVGSGSTAIYPLIVDGLAGGSFFIWGAQVETTDFGATPYIATTTAAVSVGPVANVPRLDYLNSSCPRLLLEPQRSNLITFSDGLVVAQAFGATLTKNQITSPDGYVNASLLTPLGGAAGITLATASLSGNYTISGYLKGTVAGQKVQAFGDLQGVIATFTLTTSWARYTATFNSTNATGQSIYFLSGSYFTPSENNPFYVYGAQLEAGAYATSYIPTLGAAVTRGADAASKTGISSLIGQTEGTLFVDFVPNGDSQHRFNIAQAGSSNNWIFFSMPEGSNGNGRVYIRTNSTTWVDNGLGLVGAFVSGQRYKVALAYKSGSWAIYINGVLKNSGTDTFTAPSIPIDGFYPTGTGPASGEQVQVTATGLNQAILFPTRLSNADLAALTA